MTQGDRRTRKSAPTGAPDYEYRLEHKICHLVLRQGWDPCGAPLHDELPKRVSFVSAQVLRKTDWNTCSACSDQQNGGLVELRQVKGNHFAEIFNKTPVKTWKTRKCCSCFQSDGIGSLITALIFSGSARTCPLSKINPRKKTEFA